MLLYKKYKLGNGYITFLMKSMKKVNDDGTFHGLLITGGFSQDTFFRHYFFSHSFNRKEAGVV